MYVFFVLESDMENTKTGVTKVVVDDETKLTFDLYGGGFFVAVILKNDPLPAAFICRLYWDQH